MSQWTLVKTALVWQDKMVVNFGKELANISHDKLRGTRFGAGVRALAVKPDDEKLFLVGTEDGLVHLCTTGFSSGLNHSAGTMQCNAVFTIFREDLY